MKKLLNTMFISAFTFGMAAQNLDLPTDYIRNTLSGKNNVKEYAIGSVYLNEEFKKGEVTIGNKTFDAYLRYNALNDIFETRSQSGEIEALMRRPDIKITLNGKNYRIENFIDNNEMSKQRYFVILADEDNLFLKDEGVELQEAEKANTSYEADKPATLKPYEKYYIKKGDAPAVEVRLRKKDILRKLDEEKLEKYVKENKMKLKDESEVIQLFTYYNSL